MSASPANVIKRLKTLADPQIASHSQRFFKTGPGEYGEGDRFLGIRVPTIRKQVLKFKPLSLLDTLTLLKSDFHEVRLFAVLMLVELYKHPSIEDKSVIYQAYLDHSKWVNNWDLVDSSAHKIVGLHLFNQSRAPLYQLANSSLLWDRRIAMIACYYFIKKDDYADVLKLSELLLADDHDLIHKAVGWMLRELGKRNFDVEYQFLAQHYQHMPRTMLRYAIEKFSPCVRSDFLNDRI